MWRSYRNCCAEELPPRLPKLAFVSGSNSLSPWSPTDEPMVKPNMYLVSSSWNPPLSCARAVIGFEIRIAAVAAKIRYAGHSTRARFDAFCLLEDIPPAPLDWTALTKCSNSSCCQEKVAV